MTISPTTIWQGEDGSVASDGLFHIIVPDEAANGVTGSSFEQNTSVYLLVQHDPSIKITRILASMGQVQSNPRTVSYSQSEQIEFTVDNPEHELVYLPDTGSVDGVWFVGYPAKDFNSSGTPDKVIAGRTITVDISGFDDIPVPLRADYTATFKQYEWIPVQTDLVDQDEQYPVLFTIFFDYV